MQGSQGLATVVANHAYAGGRGKGATIDYGDPGGAEMREYQVLLTLQPILAETRSCVFSWSRKPPYALSSSMASAWHMSSCWSLSVHEHPCPCAHKTSSECSISCPTQHSCTCKRPCLAVLRMTPRMASRQPLLCPWVIDVRRAATPSPKRQSGQGRRKSRS